MPRVIVQYEHKGKKLSVDMGDWQFIPEKGDEIGLDGGILVVQQRRWKIQMKAWERELRVALKCKIKE